MSRVIRSTAAIGELAKKGPQPLEGIFFIVFAVFLIWLVVWLYILLPARMAEERGRSQFGWVLLSLLFSPILACLLLFLLGNDPNSRT
jgi:hypothetical protein